MISIAPTVRVVACLTLIDLWSWLFRFYDLGRGLERGILLAVLALFLATIARWRYSGPVRLALRPLQIAVIVAGLAWVVLAVFVTHAVVVSGDLALDQGQDTYRAAIYLRRGENPYGKGAVLDRMTFADHLAAREAAGAGPKMPQDQVDATFEQYWRDLDTQTRTRLVPTDVPPASEAERQIRLLGYKYGPVPVLLAAPFVGVMGPATIEIESALGCLGLFVSLAGLWRARGFAPELCALGLLAALCEIQIPWNFIRFTATDVWPLMFGFGALWARALGRERLAGLGMALAICSKIIPGGLFVLLLLRDRKPRELIWFGAAAAVLWGPFLLWDARGFGVNNLLWSLYVAQTRSAWLGFVAPAYALLARVLLGAGALWLAWRALTCPERRVPLFMALLTMTVIAAGKIFHNNYVPWFSCWALWFVLEQAGADRPLLPPNVDPLAVP